MQAFRRRNTIFLLLTKTIKQMKKLLTLLTLLLTSVGAATSAWAETYDNEVLTVTWADPSTITAGTANVKQT